MVKSTAGKFRDIISLTPETNLNSSTINSAFKSIVPAIFEAGLTVVGISVDNFSANRKFYVNELCGGVLKSSIDFPVANKTWRIHLLFDATHCFKNCYNNFLNKKKFVCPPFLDEEVGNPDFKHIESLFKMESGKSIKMAHKLKEVVLHPVAIEKTNVRLADSLFHESTIAALDYYASHGHPEFTPTARFLKIVRKFWNIVNVKTPTAGQMKRDSTK